MAEKTAMQSVVLQIFADNIIPRQDSQAWFAKVRLMRKQPTIALVRELVIAPALAAGWTVEAEEDAPEGAKEFIDKQMQPHRLKLLRTAMLGVIDFGWSPFEKVFDVSSTKEVVIKKFKPLLQDITEIAVKRKTGAFDGLRNTPVDGTAVIDLSREHSLLFSIDVEGTDWYGQAILKNLEDAYDDWVTVGQSASRYDEKIAGAMWVVHYPLGKSNYLGETLDNGLIADKILDALRSSGALKVPRYVAGLSEDIDDESKDAWKIELITDPGSAKAAFIDRQSYLDKLFARGLGLPERSVLEGQFGTKADAQAHADFAITNIELRHLMFVHDINKHAVNQLLRLNWGEQFEDTVHIEPAPLTDVQLVFLKEVFTALMTNPETALDVVDQIDKKALQDKLGIPIEEQEDDDDLS